MKGTIIIELPDTNEEQITKYEKIFRILIDKGALDGIKGGKTIIHFDGIGKFRGISFDYFVWKET